MGMDTECVVSMEPGAEETKLLVPRNSPENTNPAVKTFYLDKSLWSHIPSAPHYASQEDVYSAVGEDFLDQTFEGYHTCIFTYGPTGSGKSHTMLGNSDNPGLVPRTCQDLFERIDSSESPNVTYNVRVSYFEVTHDERVRDLIAPRTMPWATGSSRSYYLNIREREADDYDSSEEDSDDALYMRNLTETPVHSLDEALRCIHEGDASRKKSPEAQTSEASHAIFTLVLKQIYHDLVTDQATERVARMKFVDLSGSDRADDNKSLSTFANIIQALDNFQRASQDSDSSRAEDIPYRDSILTFLMRDNLGRNSRVAMIACLAPSEYDSTLSTLQFAEQVKRIRTRAIVNQETIPVIDHDAQIAELTETIRFLQYSIDSQESETRNDKKRNRKFAEYQKQVSRQQRLMEDSKMISESKVRQLTVENEALKLQLKLALDSMKTVPPPRQILNVEKTRDRAFDNDNLSSVIDEEEEGNYRAQELEEYQNEQQYETGENVVSSKKPSEPRIMRKRPSSTPIIVPSGSSSATTITNHKTPSKSMNLDHPPAEPSSTSSSPTLSASPSMAKPSVSFTEDTDATSLPEEDADSVLSFKDTEVHDMQSQMAELLTDLKFFKRKVADDHQRFGIEKDDTALAQEEELQTQPGQFNLAF